MRRRGATSRAAKYDTQRQFRLTEDGRFGYPLDERWWTDASHHPFPGPWEVRMRDNNIAARQFWLRALEPAKPTLSAALIDGVAWQVLRVG